MPSLSQSLHALDQQLGSESSATALHRLLRVPEALGALRDPETLERALDARGDLAPRSLITSLLAVNGFTERSWTREVRENAKELADDPGQPAAPLMQRALDAADMIRRLGGADDSVVAEIKATPDQFRSALALALPDIPDRSAFVASLAGSAQFDVRLLLWNAYLAQEGQESLAEILEADGLEVTRQMVQDLLAAGEMAAAASLTAELESGSPPPPADGPEIQLNGAVAKLARLDLEAAHDNLESAWDSATERTARIADSMADLAAQSGDTVLEIQARERALESRPSGPRRAALATTYVSDDQPERALSVLAEAATCPQEHIAAGHAHLQTGDREQARQEFEIGATATTLDANWLRSLAEGWVGLGELGRATSALSSGLARFPSHLAIQRRLAELEFESGREAEAADRATVVARLDPEDQSLQLLLAQATQAAGRPDEALPIWLQLVEEDPNLQAQAVDCALAAEELSTALSLSQALVEADPASPRGRVALGKSMLAAGNSRAGQVHLRRATEIAPDEPEPWLALAQSQVTDGATIEAGETLAAAAQACPQAAEIHAAYGRWLAADQRWTEASEAIDRARRLDPENAQFMALQGQWLRHLGRLEEAEVALESSLARKPQNWAARTALASLHEARGAFEQAATQLEGLPKDSEPECHALAARVLLQLPADQASAEAGKSLRHLRLAEDMGLDEPDLHFWFGRAHQLQGDLSQAIQAYQHCVKQLPEENGELYEACVRGEAEAALASGQFPVAISVLERARESGRAGHETLVLLSRAYLAAGLSQEALTPALEACEKAPADPTARSQFLSAAQRAGNPQLALDKLALWTEEDPLGTDLLLQKAELHGELAQNAEARSTVAQALWQGRRDTELVARSAATLSRIGDPIAAKRLLQVAVDREPGRHDLASLLGKAAEAANDAETARRSWLQVLETEPNSIEALIGAANAHWKLDQRVSAIGFLQRAVSQEPDRGDLHAQLARAQLDNGEIQRALEHFRIAASKSPENREVTLEAAHALIENGSAEQAKQILEPLARHALHDDAVVAASAETYLELGRPEQALTVLRRIPEDDRTPLIHSLFALAHAASERPEPAMASLQVAVEGSADAPDELDWLARAALRLGSWQVAAEVAQELHSIPDDSGAHLKAVMVSCRLADAHTLFGRMAGVQEHGPSQPSVGHRVRQRCLEAIDTLSLSEAEQRMLHRRLCLAFDPTLSGELQLDIEALPRARRLREQAVEGLALAQITSGQQEEALKTLAQSHRNAHGGCWGALLAGLAHLRAGRGPMARKALGAAGADPILHPLAAYFAAESWAAESSWDEAINNLNSAVLEWPEEVGWQQRLAELYLQDGRPEAALPHLQQALEITPDDLGIQTTLARALDKAGHLSEADQAYARITDSVEAAPMVLLEAAEVALQAGSTARARALYERVLEADPEHPTGRVGAAKAALAVGDKAAAEKHAAIALRHSPEDPKVLLALGQVCAQQGKHQQALDLYERAQRWSRGSDALTRARGQLLVRMGRGHEAVESLRALAESSGESALNWATLAEALEAVGQTGQAIDALRMALRLQPSSAEYRVRRARLYRLAGQLDQALSELTELRSDLPQDYRVPLELGLVHKERRQFRRALESFERAIQLEATSAAAHYQAAMVLKTLKAYKRASQMMARAVELNPDDSNALHQLAAVQALELVHGGINTAVTQ